MGRRKKTDPMYARIIDEDGNPSPEHRHPRRLRPATTPEAREARCISLAYDLVEQRLIDGTASSQETTHFLKLATEEAKLKREAIREDTRLRRAKTEALDSAKRVEALYENAIKAMRNYSGNGDPEEYVDDD